MHRCWLAVVFDGFPFKASPTRRMKNLKSETNKNMGENSFFIRIMKRVLFLLFAVCVFFPHAKAQKLDTLQARVVMSRVDSIFNQLPQREKNKMSFLRKEELFLREALREWHVYDFLRRTFGDDIMDIYMNPDNVEDPGFKSRYFGDRYAPKQKRYPLGECDDYNSGSYNLYKAAQWLTEYRDYFDRAQWNHEIFRDYNRFYMRETKPYDVRDLQPLANLFKYPDAYAYLASGDTLLMNIKSIYRYSNDNTDLLIRFADSILLEKQQTIGPEHPCYALTLSDLATFYCRKSLQDYPKAILLQEKALNILIATGCTQAIQQAAMHLSYIHYLQRKDAKRKDGSSSYFEQFIEWNRREIAAIEPCLGSDAFEVKCAYNELRELEKERQKAVRREAWAKMDSIFNEMTDSEKSAVRRRFFDDRYSGYYEYDHHYIRAAMVERQYLNDLEQTFGKAVCDTLVLSCRKGWYTSTSEDTIKISHVVNKIFEEAIFKNHSQMKYRLSSLGEDAVKKYAGDRVKQFDVLKAQEVVDAHQYPKRYSYLAVKDDSVALCRKKGDYDLGIKLAQELLKVKERAFGKKHPLYALALSDLAELYTKEVPPPGEKRQKHFRHAVSMQTEALNIYQDLHLDECSKLSAQFLSFIYYYWMRCSPGLDSRTQEEIDSLAEIKRQEIAVISPVLGETSPEVIAARAELLKIINAPSDLIARRHEVGEESSSFQRAVDLYRQGKYQDALDKFLYIQKNERFSYLWIRRGYVYQWAAACYLQLGDTASAKGMDTYYLLDPLDRSRTLELDYLCTYEPDNPRFLGIARDTLGEGTLEFARMMLMASDLIAPSQSERISNARCERATNYLLIAKAICQKQVGKSSPVYSQILNRIGELYFSMHYYQEAIDILEETLPLVAQTYGKRSNSYIQTLNKLIEASKALDDYARIAHWKEELLNVKEGGYYRYEEIEEIAEALVSKAREQKSDTASVLHAMELYHQAMDMREQLLAKWYPSGLNYADMDSLYSYVISRRRIDIVDKKGLVSCLFLLGKNDEAKRMGNECSNWLSQFMADRFGNGQRLTNEKEAYTYYKLVDLLSYTYWVIGLRAYMASDFSYAEEAFQEAKKLREEYGQKAMYKDNSIASAKVMGANALYDGDDYYIDAFLGTSLHHSRHYEECVSLLQKTRSLWEENVGTRDYKYYLVCRALVSSLIALQRNDKAGEIVCDWWQFRADASLKQLAVLNGPQRENYWDKQKGTFEQTIPTYLVKINQPATNEVFYDNALLCKGLLLNTEMEIGRLISENGDAEQKTLYQQLRESQLLLMNEMQKPERFQSIDIDSLQISIRSQENALLGTLQQQRSEEIVRGLRPDWRDVQKHLKKQDIAVEFVTVPFNNDDVQYCALTLRHNDKNPHLTRLFTLKELRDVDKADYYNTSRLYDMLWRPLLGELSGVNNIYFSPAGVLHQIGVEYLPGMEKFNIFRLSSTRELMRSDDHHEGDYVAALYGGLKFELSSDERAALAVQQQSKSSTHFRDVPDMSQLRELRGAVPDMPVLEGSLREVQDIDSLMRQKHVDVTTAMGTDGTEESFKALSGQHKSIIHISTHGFYQSEDQSMENDEMGIMLGNQRSQTREDRSLSRSGLLMTGAADYIFGVAPEIGADDGVLTAREISRMDLSGLDLVVLSACETGLGDITGEGVFGLQRGFKKAGAQTLLVSLWKVEDDATQLLMTEFYRNLLSGKTKRQSFLEAQQTLRQVENGRFNRYECWASFVMIDGLK